MSFWICDHDLDEPCTKNCYDLMAIQCSCKEIPGGLAVGMKHLSDCILYKKVEEVKMDGQPRLDGKKYDDGKNMLGLVPKSLIWAVGWILTFGAKKYGEHNWRKGLKWSRAYNALLRHLTAWWDGESLDKESGKSHLWHAATELSFLIEYEETSTGEDDRYKNPQ